MIWTTKPDLERLNESGKKRMPEHVGIEFVEYGDDFLLARMPVDHRTTQPHGLLHGGASVVLAETLGSVASIFCIDLSEGKVPVGVEINANHLNSVKSGYVYGRVEPIKLGRRMHVWQIKIKDENDKLICVSRLTVAIVDRR